MKRITIIAAALATAALATTYIQTSSTGVAPWKPVKDSVSRAQLADSALKADSSRAAWKADSAKKAGTATKLAAARTIGMSGDVTGTATAFDGTANITIPTTLPTLLTAGSAGSATSVPTLTWDAKGRLTASGSTAISISHTQINDWGTYINQPLLTTSSPTFASATIANGVYRTHANDATVAAIYGSAVTPSGTNYALAWNQGGSGSYLNGTTSSNLFVNNSPVLSATATGITAYQPIVGNLTGHASLDIPLTGSSAITGPLVSSSTATFSSAAIANGVYRSYTNDATVGAIYGSSLVPSGQNYTLAWNQNGSGSYLNGTTSSNLFVNNSPVLSATATGITAYQPITGNFNGHASLDIPLTGSSAITGALVSSNSSDIGSTADNWGTVYATCVKSTGTTSISSFSLSGDTLTLSHANGDLIWRNAIRGSEYGLVLQNTIISGTFSPAVNSPSTAYTISSSDQGKMVVSNNQLNLPTPTGVPKGFWCLVNWHVGGGMVKFGPAYGTAWYFRGTGLTTLTSEPFTGIVSWDGYTWYAN